MHRRARIAVAVLLTLAQLLLVALYVGVIAYKLTVDGWLSWAQHFTNWSWALQTLFYTLTLPAYLIVALERGGWALALQARIIVVLFLPLWGIVCTVLILVVTMLLDGATFLDEIARSMALGELVIGNEVVHVFTVGELFLWAIVNAHLLYWAYNEAFAARAVHRSRALFWALALSLTVLLPLATLLLYAAIFNANQVYGVDLALALGLLVVLAALLVATSPLYAFLFLFYLGDEPLDSRWLTSSTFEALGDRVATTYGRFKWARD